MCVSVCVCSQVHISITLSFDLIFFFNLQPYDVIYDVQLMLSYQEFFV